MPVLDSIAARLDEMIAWRRHLHAHPELAFEEVATAGFVADRLAAFGIEVHRGLAGTGVVGVLRHGNSPRSVGLRADMDALAMTERNGFAHASRHPGKMHGCGHDGHTAMLLGAARHLAETRNFDGTVHLIFQPAEEGAGGAKVMIDQGLFDRFPCDTVFGMHNWPQLPPGTFGVRAGPVMAAADHFEITVTGKGGHGAMPQLGIDPVLVAAHIVTAAQSLVSRGTDPVDAAVVSVTMIQGGSAFNVIPDTVTLSGTVRSFRPETQDRLQHGLARIAERVAAAFGATAETAYRRNYPATLNSRTEAAVAASVAAQVVGAQNVHRDLEPSMAAEDFAFMLEQRPGCYVWLGQGGGAASCMLHNPHYDFQDQILPVGASYWVLLAETALPRGT
jgi:hippurate hydrolase